MGMIGIFVILGLLASLAMVVMGAIYAVKSRENRVLGLVLLVMGGLMLLGAGGFVAYAFLMRA